MDDGEELKEIRRCRMTKIEKFREWAANATRTFLLFTFPVMLFLFMFIVLVIIYIILPYKSTRGFTRTSCEVVGYSVLNHSSSSCSAGTDSFQPCVKVEVSYWTGEAQQTSVIMENEQALNNCGQCSYTFGLHGLFHQYQYACESWRENFNPDLCVRDFILKNAVVGNVNTCYFNPQHPNQVVGDITLDETLLIHRISWPILICFAYFVGWGFVCYDKKQRKLVDKWIEAEVSSRKAREQLEQYRALEWKKQRLGQTLGVRPKMQSLNSFATRARSDLKRMSISLQSLTDLNKAQTIVHQIDVNKLGDDDESTESNLHFLDLAVSQQNLNRLTTTYPYMETPPPLTFANVTAAFETKESCNLRGLSAATLPVSRTTPFSMFRKTSQPHRKSMNAFFPQSSSVALFDQHKLRGNHMYVGSASFGPVTNGSMFYQERRERELADKTAVSEDEIDLYFSIGKRFSENALIDIKRRGVFRRKDESMV